jgi:hypothetical protein
MRSRSVYDLDGYASIPPVRRKHPEPELTASEKHHLRFAEGWLDLGLESHARHELDWLREEVCGERARLNL